MWFYEVTAQSVRALITTIWVRMSVFRIIRSSQTSGTECSLTNGIRRPPTALRHWALVPLPQLWARRSRRGRNSRRRPEGAKDQSPGIVQVGPRELVFPAAAIAVAAAVVVVGRWRHCPRTLVWGGIIWQDVVFSICQSTGETTSSRSCWCCRCCSKGCQGFGAK